MREVWRRGRGRTLNERERCTGRVAEEGGVRKDTGGRKDSVCVVVQHDFCGSNGP